MIPIKKKIKNKYHQSDIINLYILFFISVAAIYLASREIAIIWQVTLLIAFVRSKKDYFWLAFVFIVENFPGALFSRYTSDIQHTFSLLPESPAGTLYFWMVFMLIALVKTLPKKAPYRLIIQENIKILFLYFLVLVLAFGLYKWTAVSRSLLPWLFLFILPRLFKTEKDFTGFFRLIFSFVFLVLATQVFQILFGLTLAKFLGGSNVDLVADELEGVVRPWDGIFIPYMALFGSLYYLTFKEKYFNDKYLLTIAGLAVFSIFMTATRSWLISAFFITGGYFFFITRAKSNIVLKLSIPFVLIIVIIHFVPVVDQQVDLAVQRYETVQFLLKGDITAGGTLKRFDIRSPQVLEKFAESPLLGWGYGNEAREYSDGHVGNENLLMHTGIIGYLLWLILWMHFILKMKRLNDKLSVRNPYKNLPKLFILTLLGILIINASVQWFNYLIGVLPGFTFIFLFTHASFVYKQARQYEANQLKIKIVQI